MTDISDDYLTSYINSVTNIKNGQAIDNVYKELRRPFLKNNIRFDLLSREIVKIILELPLVDEIQRKNLLDQLYINVCKINYDTFNVRELLHFYSLFLRIGAFHAGYILREMAVKKTIEEVDTNSPRNKLKKGVHAALERSEFSLAGKWLKTISSQKRLINFDGAIPGIHFSRSMNFLIDLLSNDNLLFKMPFYIKKESNKDFFQYIKDKEVAIVGPAKTDFTDGKEIDSFDIVMRFNYRKKGIYWDPAIKGQKRDLAYYNFEQAEQIIKSKMNFPDDVDWIVLKTDLQKPKFDKSSNNVPKRKSLKFYSVFTFNGSLNMLPLVLLDLLQYEPKKIKVFHSDLMLTVERDTKYFPDAFDREGFNKMSELFMRESVSHDPVGQYLILSKLLKNNYIEGDQRFVEVLNLGVEEYMKQLQGIYRLNNSLLVSKT